MVALATNRKATGQDNLTALGAEGGAFSRLPSPSPLSIQTHSTSGGTGVVIETTMEDAAHPVVARSGDTALPSGITVSKAGDDFLAPVTSEQETG